MAQACGGPPLVPNVLITVLLIGVRLREAADAAFKVLLRGVLLTISYIWWWWGGWRRRAVDPSSLVSYLEASR